MIAIETFKGYLTRAFPDADVRIVDNRGTLDHFTLFIVSDAFDGIGLLDRHRMVQAALKEPMDDGRIHALEIRAEARSGQ
ncbi:MAG: BolA family protein [Candidatus Sericytochromatia bacterium]|nr:BolA family protein [Candidatus Sericytochromatia bacterium]